MDRGDGFKVFIELLEDFEDVVDIELRKNEKAEYGKI